MIPEKVTLTLSDATNSLVLFKDGMPTEPNEELASKILENRDIAIKVELALGKYSANMYTCDMSHEYISINADYRN